MNTVVKFSLMLILGAGLGFGAVVAIRHPDQLHPPPLEIRAESLPHRPAAPSQTPPVNIPDLPFGGKRLSWWRAELRALWEHPDSKRRALFETRARANGLQIINDGALVDVRPTKAIEACISGDTAP